MRTLPKKSTSASARGHRLFVVGATAFAALGITSYLAVSPHLTLQNDGIRLAYPVFAGLSIAIGAMGLGVLAALWPHIVARLSLAGLATLLLLGSAQRLTYRIEADKEGLRLRTPTLRTAVPWHQIARAHTTGESLFLLAKDGRRFEVALGELTPQHRVAVTRSISRRVSEAAGIAAP